MDSDNHQEIEKNSPSSASSDAKAMEDKKAPEGKLQYNPQSIEPKWQKNWEEKKYSKSEDFSKKPKHYHLVEFPYPSGEGLHVGHCMGYGASDAYSRMKRMQGFNVMYPIGWDAFGLPTENYAIKTGIMPQEATKKNTNNFKRQMKTMGYSFDWERLINTADPNYYKWTQWIFLQFYRHSYQNGKLVLVDDDDSQTPRMAYQAEMPVNWCPSCKIILANEEVIGNSCERCGTETEKRMQKQWMLRITAYAERLINDLNKVDYPEQIKVQQTNWIGRSEGADVEFIVQPSGSKITVFTTRPDTLFGATFIAVSPEHKFINAIKNDIKNWDEISKYIEAAKKKSDIKRTEFNNEKTGVELDGIRAVNPVNQKEIPIFVADYILASYSYGVCMCVPAHDQRDWEFAKKFNLEIVSVVKPQNGSLNNDQAFSQDGIAINSEIINDLKTPDAKKKIIEYLEQKGIGKFTVNYKLRDWIFSRQHYWGEPIPIVYCDKCGIRPLDEKDLPLKLPEIKNYQPTDTGESPLAKVKDWVNTTCPKCGGKARRETDTMPNWAGSSWYYLRYTDTNSSQGIADKKKLDYWLPVDVYNGGMEHTNLHLLYSRFWHKFLFDLGKAPGEEPYQKRVTHGIILGQDNQKMSKSRGNTINPDEMVEQFGADTLRAYIMFIGPYNQEAAWNMGGIQGVYRFLKRVWVNFEKVNDKEDKHELLTKLNQTIVSVTHDLETFQFNTVVSALMEFNNVIEKAGSVSKQSYQTFLRLLFPICPHIADELWQKTGGNDTIEDREWPKPEKKYLVADQITIAVQVNGKTRGIIEIASSAEQKEVEQKTRDNEKIKKQLEGKEIIKVIFVPGKIINFVVK